MALRALRLVARRASSVAAPVARHASSAAALVGRCTCGDVTLTLDAGAEPSFAPAFCHCNNCRAFHGSAFAMEAGFRREQCEVRGRTTGYRTSRHFERLRCATCGTPCGGVHHKLGAIFVPTALFAAPGAAPPASLLPTMHLFYSRRIVGDVFEGDGLPKHAAMPPPE